MTHASTGRAPAAVRASFLRELEWRGLVADITDGLAEHLAAGARTLYVGFDPTADSLHVGSLLPLLTLRRAQEFGHRPIVLIGGGTGLIGDPSGKAAERALNPAAQVAAWAERLKAQVRRFVDFDRGALLIDNYTWLSRLEVIPFLRDIGKHFPLGAMLARESVRARMGRPDGGLSYTEFSYQVLQAYDFLALYREHGCTLQMGGTDQWGNITAGIELIRRVEHGEAYGLTLPLVTKTDGSKFGKTESGTIWLDAARTSAYEMYQFWLNTADADAGRYLRYFTMLDEETVAALEARLAAAPEHREAQRALAREATALVHGTAAVEEAERISAALFSGDLRTLSEGELAQAAAGMPSTRLARGELEGLAPVDLLVRTGLAPSRSRARELLGAGGVQVNGVRLSPEVTRISAEWLRFGKYIVLRRGKKQYHAVILD